MQSLKAVSSWLPHVTKHGSIQWSLEGRWQLQGFQEEIGDEAGEECKEQQHAKDSGLYFNKTESLLQDLAEFQRQVWGSTMLEEGRLVETLLSYFRKRVFITWTSNKVGKKRSEKIQKVSIQEVDAMRPSDSLGVEARERDRQTTQWVIC